MQERGGCPTYIDYFIPVDLPLSVVSSNVPVATTEAYTASVSTLIPATPGQVVDSASTSGPETLSKSVIMLRSRIVT